MRCRAGLVLYNFINMNFILALSLLSLVNCYTNGEGYHKCPFNEEECMCYDDPDLPPGDPYQFRLAKCRSKNGKMVKFYPSPGAKYNITLQMEIFDTDVTQIPADHFAAFENIDYLALTHLPTDPDESTKISWDDHAFRGVKINHLITSGLDGIMPPPKVISDLNLVELSVWNTATPVSFPDNAFSKLPNLDAILIGNSDILSFSPKAFVGLENQLYSVAIMHTNLSDLVTEVGSALKGFSELQLLDLTNSSIADIKKTDFADMPKLRDFSINDNPLLEIENGALSNGLKRVRCIDISRTSLEAIDLALFADIERTWVIPGLSSLNVFLFRLYSLKHLTTTVTKKFAYHATIFLEESGLETIDPAIGDLLNNVPDLYVDIRFNLQLKCENLHWMSKIECPHRMNIDGAKCADKDNKPLNEYLQEIDPDSKCHSSKPGQNFRGNDIILC